MQTGETLIKLEQYMHLGSLLKETATLHEKLHKMFHAMEVDDLDRQATGKMLFHLLLLQVWAAIHVQETVCACLHTNDIDYVSMLGCRCDLS